MRGWFCFGVVVKRSRGGCALSYFILEPLVQDADIVWFRNPFNHFVDDADFQISSDKFKGNPRSTVDNRPNCGYVFTRSNNHTIALYTHWCNGGKRYPKVDEQSQLGGMLQRGELKKLGVRVRFLPTELFSGFCEVSKDMRKVVTMHANCCTGLENKLADLRFSMEDWETGKDSPPKFRKVGNETITRSPWRAPSACKHSIWPNRGRKKNHTVSPTPTPWNKAWNTTHLENTQSDCWVWIWCRNLRGIGFRYL